MWVEICRNSHRIDMPNTALKICKETAKVLQAKGWVLSNAAASFVVLERQSSVGDGVLSIHRLMLNLSFPKHQLPSENVYGIVPTLKVYFPTIERMVSTLADAPISDLTFMVGAQILPAESVYAGSVLLIDSAMSLAESVDELWRLISPLLKVSEISSTPGSLLDSRVTGLVSKRFFWEEKQLAYHWISRDERALHKLIDDIEAGIAVSKENFSVDVLDFGREEASTKKLQKMISNIKLGRVQ